MQLCIELNKIEKERDINTRKKDLRRNLEIKRKRERGVEIVEKSTCREIALHSQRLATLTAGFCLLKKKILTIQTLYKNDQNSVKHKPM